MSKRENERNDRDGDEHSSGRSEGRLPSYSIFISCLATDIKQRQEMLNERQLV